MNFKIVVMYLKLISNRLHVIACMLLMYRIELGTIIVRNVSVLIAYKLISCSLTCKLDHLSMCAPAQL